MRDALLYCQLQGTRKGLFLCLPLSENLLLYYSLRGHKFAGNIYVLPRFYFMKDNA